MSTEDEDYYEVSSGNVWADVGRPDAEEALARAELMRQITHIIRSRRLTQVQAAEVLATNQPTVSDLMRGKLSKFSLERLISFINALGHDVEIVVHRREIRSRKPGRLLVADREADEPERKRGAA